MSPSIRGMTPDEIRDLLRQPVRAATPRSYRLGQPVLEPRIHPEDRAELRFDHDR